MSSKRSSGRSNEIEDLSRKLQELFSTNMKKKKKRNANKLLDEVCSYIKKLNGEVDDLSIQISELMASSSLDNNNNNSSINADILTQLLQQ